MILYKANIAIASCYEAPYGGNFIKMITALASKLENEFQSTVYLVFPKQTEKEWLKKLINQFHVIFTRKPYCKSTDDFVRLFNEKNINLIHTHFEAYDIPVAKAIKRVNRNIKMAWHLHDYQSLDKTGLTFKWLRKIGTNLRLWRQYGFYGKKAYFIGVSAEMTNFVCHYREHCFSFPKALTNEQLANKQFIRAEVVINGISLDRLKGQYTFPENFCFLSFGGESISKGIPCILDAAELLHKSSIKVSVMITKGYTTEELIKQRYNNDIPTWLSIIDQTQDITKLFDQSSCYISASLKETMSMAIAEASIYGLPVIQSDIPGTWWNSKNPSTFLFPVNNARKLAEQMKKVIQTNKNELWSRCQETAAHNKNLLSMDNWCQKIIGIYSKV